MIKFYDDFRNVFFESKSFMYVVDVLYNIAKDVNFKLNHGETVNEIDIRNKLYATMGLSLIEMPELIKQQYNLKGRDMLIHWSLDPVLDNNEYAVGICLMVN